MASCITEQWVSGGTCPQVKLTVTVHSHTDTKATLSWTLQYVAHGYSAITTNAKEYSVTIAGNEVASGTYNIDGISSTTTINSGRIIVDKNVSSRTVTFSCTFGFNLNWSGYWGGDRSASGTISIPGYTTYTVTYNDNGGTGAPSSQTKTYSKALTLSNTKPTRSGYIFQGWGTSSSDTTVDYDSGDIYTANASITLYAIWVKQYTITYNANGGTGAPSSQTKTHGSVLTLSSTKPTRSGYVFQGWGTSSSDTTVDYDPGDSYTTNASITLYAIWTALTYTVAYGANGGTGAPSTQTKTYDVPLVLSSTIPTRTYYKFLGWATSASATEIAYSPGDTYVKNAAITLYAVWEYVYVKPTIYNLVASRCDSEGVVAEEGTYMNLTFDWECTYDVSSITVSWSSSSGDSDPTPLSASGTNGTANEILGEFSTETSYTIIVTVTDSGGSTLAKVTLNGAVIPIDARYGGKGLAFGKPAEFDDTVEFGWAAKFNKPVYGNVAGLNKLPEIVAGEDFNNYMETGCWSVYTNANAETISNMPVQVAGRLEVFSSTGEGITLEEWSYLRQKFTPYNVTNAVWERDVVRRTDNVWEYGDWHPSNLTPAASKKVYHNQKTLWIGSSYMHADQAITLSEAVSEQANGIVLVFSEYKTGSDYEGFASFFVPKILVNTSNISTLHSFTMMNSSFGLISSKYLYITDTTISGHANNNTSGTSNGITYNNKNYVLRYVYGV